MKTKVEGGVVESWRSKYSVFSLPSHTKAAPKLCVPAEEFGGVVDYKPCPGTSFIPRPL